MEGKLGSKLNPTAVASCVGRKVAFTLIELLVVIGIIAILAALLLPTLHRAKASGVRAVCQSNLRQLQICFQEYSDENGQFPSNNLVLVVNWGTVLGPSWAPGDLNQDSAIDQLENGSLFPYNNSRGIYRCPADRSLADTSGEAGARPARAHSYNLSIWFNCITEPYGYVSESEIDGCGKSSSDIFTFIDTHEDTIVDPAFGIYHSDDGTRRNLWVDMPADRHSGGANLAFLDGHVEYWKWRAPKILASRPQRTASDSSDRNDLRRLQEKLPPRLTRSFWELPRSD